VTDQQLPPCEVVDDEDVECFECFDTGRIQTEGLVLPCLVCPAGDRHLYHTQQERHAPQSNPTAEANHH
jgi:hypothetical protein